MKTILVSLISDQTIPNLQLIKEKNVDGYLFVSTEAMNKKGTLEWLLLASKIDETKPVTVINVNAFSYDDIEAQLSAAVNDEDHYIVNLTGGTKIMSLAVNDFFKDINAEMYYLTGANDYIKIFPGRTKPTFELQTKITLEEYLVAYGFSIGAKSTPIKPIVTTKNILDYFLDKITKEDFLVLENVRVNFRSKKKKINDLEKIAGLKELMERLQFDFVTPNCLNENEVKYLTGEWLEEYVYHVVKEKYNLSDDQIGMGWFIEKETVKNEFDVLYIQNNQIKTIECKTSIYLDLEEKRTIIGETIYKSDSLKNKFGLFASTTILTASDLKNVKQNDLNRADANRIKVLGKEVFQNNSINI
jgi:uncharacterized protein YuzE